MNILKIVDSRKWGIEACQALYTAVQLKKSGHNVTIMCPGGCPLHYETVKYDIPVKPMPLLAKLGFLEGSLYDVVHFYDPASANALLMKRIAAASRIFVSQIRMGSSKNLLRLKALEPYVSRFIASCPSALEDLCAAGIAQEKIFIVPAAVNTGRWESAMLIKPAMLLKRPHKVGTISMDASLKEQEFFFRTAKEVLKVLPETHFMVVGLKDDRIRAMARDFEISHKVDILWERTDIPEVMAMLHIFVKSAGRAGLSMSLIEAQASGVPCVVGRVRGMSDHIVHESNGLLAEPGNPGSFARAVAYLIENPLVSNAIARMAYDHVNFNMSAPVAANLLARLYEDSQNQLQ